MYVCSACLFFFPLKSHRRHREVLPHSSLQSTLIPIFHLNLTQNVKVAITDFKRDESRYVYHKVDL